MQPFSDLCRFTLRSFASDVI